MGSDALVDVYIEVAPDLSVSEAHHISETVRLKVIREIDEVADVMVHIDPEDDEHMQFNGQLPMRTEVSRQLEACCEDISAAKHIKKMILHYLDGKIRLELVLPLSVLEHGENSQQLQARFENAIKESDNFESIIIRFQ